MWSQRSGGGGTPTSHTPLTGPYDPRARGGGSSGHARARGKPQPQGKRATDRGCAGERNARPGPRADAVVTALDKLREAYFTAADGQRCMPNLEGTTNVSSALHAKNRVSRFSTSHIGFGRSTRLPFNRPHPSPHLAMGVRSAHARAGHALALQTNAGQGPNVWYVVVCKRGAARRARPRRPRATEGRSCLGSLSGRGGKVCARRSVY